MSPAAVQAPTRHAARWRRAHVRSELPRKPFKAISDAGIEEAVRIVKENEQGRQYKARSDQINNVANLVHCIQRWAFDSGNGIGYSCHFDIARALYGADRIRSREDAEKLSMSIWRWAKVAERAGLLRLEEVVRANGSSACLRWELLDPALDSERGADVAQLAKATPLCELRRRAEKPSERVQRRSRPYARRTGREGVGRLAPPRRSSGPRHGPLSFSSEESVEPSSPFSSEKGLENSAPARAAAGGLDRRAQAFAEAHRLAALDRRRTAAAKGVPLQAVQGALRGGAVSPPAAVLAGWIVLFDSEPRLSRQRFEQLERSLSMAERVRCSRTEGPEWLLGAMRDHAGRLAAAARNGEPAGPPTSIAYFIVPFRRIARSMRRDWRRRKAAAGAQGRRASSQQSKSRGRRRG